MTATDAAPHDVAPMKRAERALAQSVCESICATTPRSSNRHYYPRISRASIFGWAAVAALCLITLAMASGYRS